MLYTLPTQRFGLFMRHSRNKQRLFPYSALTAWSLWFAFCAAEIEFLNIKVPWSYLFSTS
jgi:hypothetical protein